MTPPTASFAAASVGDRPTFTGEAVSDAMPPPSIPEYELGEELGRGGMGVVYRARHRGLGRPAAVKLVLTGGDGSRGRVRFLAEAEAMAAVDHPNVVRVYDSGTAEGRPYLAMELLPGGSLADRLKAGPRLTPLDAAKLVEAIARGVQAAHDQGIVHRDLKPGNVLLTDDGQPKVTDFGLAKRGGTADLTRTGAVMGTPTYMAPEQARGDGKLAGPAADIWALGVILFECLTGRPPYRADDAVGLLLKVASEDAPSVRSVEGSVPRDLELVAGKCLRRDPRERYPTAVELADELGRFARGEPVEVRPMGQWERLVHWRRRNRLLYNAVAAVLVTLQVGFFVSLSFARRAGWAAENAQRAEQQAKEEAAMARAAEQKAKNAEAEQRKLRDEQKSATVRALLTAAKVKVLANDPAAAIPPLAEAHALDPVAGADRLTDALLADMPRLVLSGRHAGAVTQLAVSPDGQRLATSGLDGVARLWDPAAGTVTALPPLPGPAFAVAFAADGRELAVVGGTLLRPGYVQRFALPANTPVGPPRTVAGNPFAVAYAADGPATAEYVVRKNFLGIPTESLFSFRTAGGREWSRTVWQAPATEAFDRRFAVNGRVLDLSGNSVRVVQLAGGRSVGRFHYPGRAAVAVLSDDGRYAVVCPREGVRAAARVWDLDAGTEVRVPLVTDAVAVAAARTPGGQLVVAFKDGNVLRYSAADGRLLGGIGQPVAGGPAAVAGGASFSPDGLLLAGVTEGGTVRVFATHDREPVGPPLPHTALVSAVQFLAAGRRLAVAAADGSVRVWEFGSATPTLFSAGLNLPGEDIRPLPDGQFAVSGAGNQWRVDPEKGPQGGQVTVGPTADGYYDGAVVTPDAGLMLYRTPKRHVRLVEPGGKEVGRLPTDNEHLTMLELSPDGRYAVTSDAVSLNPPGAFTGVIRVWDVAARKELLKPKTGLTSAVAVHGAPPRVALGTGELTPQGVQGWVQVADVPTDRPVGGRIRAAPNMAVHQMAFSPDGTRLAVITGLVPVGSREVAVYEVGSGRAVVSPRSVGATAVKPVFSPDGRRLAVTAGRAVLLFDLSADGKPRRLEHRDPVGHCRFGPGGDVLVTASGANVHLWDVATGEQARPPYGMKYAVRAAALSLDGRYLVAADTGGTVTGWGLGGTRPPAATALLGRLLVGADGPDAAEADWRAVRRDHPGELAVPPDDAARWHNIRINTAMRAFEWQSASRHAEVIRALMPDWSGALYNAGQFALRAGDPPAVGRSAAGLRRNVADKPADGMHLSLIENALTDPVAVAPADRAVAQAAANWLAVVPTDNHQAMLAAALGHLRAGRLDAAEKAATAAKGSRWDGHQLRADLLLALVRQRQGRGAESAKLADAAAATMAAWEKQGPYTNWEHMGYLTAMLAEVRAGRE